MRSAVIIRGHFLSGPAHALKRSGPGRLTATCSSVIARGTHKNTGNSSKLFSLLWRWTAGSNGAKFVGNQKKFSSRSGGGIGAGGGGSSGSSFGGDGGGSSSGSGPWGVYMRWLETSPILTKSVTAAILNAIGDIISQKQFEKSPKLDLRRVLQFGFLGLVLVGPALHFWYGALATKITLKGIPGLLARLVCDQALFAPVFIGTFFSALLLLEGHPELISNKLKQDLKGALYANWQLWIPVQLLNFSLIPVNLQVLFSNTVAIGWNTFMSYKAHKQVPPAEVEL